MNSTNGYDNEPKMIKCDGCGRFFPVSEMRRCKACGGLFCADCRAVHDCRSSHTVEQDPVVEQPASVIEQPAPVVIHGLERNIDSRSWGNGEPAPEPVTDGKRTYSTLHFLDDEKDSIGSAALGSMPFGRKAADAASDPLVPLEDTTLDKPKDGYYRIPVADEQQPSQYQQAPQSPLQQPYQQPPQYQQVPQYPPQQPYQQPPQYQQAPQYPPQQPYQQPPQYQQVPQYPPQQPYQQPPQYQQAPQYPPQQPYQQPPQYQQAPQYPPQQPYQQPPQYAYAASPRVPGPDEAVCDECGEIYPKSEMRKCKKCGAVLCPKCRGKHKCKKASKKSTSGELYPQASYVHEDTSKSATMNTGGQPGKKQKTAKQPKEKKAGKKMSKRTLIIIIAACVLVAALIVAFLMIKAQDPSDLPDWLADIVVNIFPQE